MSRSTFFHHDTARQRVWISNDPERPSFESHDMEGAPEWNVGKVCVPTHVEPRMDRVRARLANEYVIVQEWDDVKHADIGLTPGVLRQAADRLGCSIPEAMDVILWHDERDRDFFSGTEEMHFSVERHAKTLGTRHIAMHHKRRSLALAMAFACDAAMNVPLSIVLGYEGSTARRMEPSLPPDLPEFPRCRDHVDLQMDVRSFVRHVDLAVRCALDSPQEITLDLKNRMHVSFQNVRMSDAVRGLEVRLSTGGVLFYRDFSLVPGTTGIVYKNRQLPQRKVPYEILEQLARDIFVCDTYHREVVNDRHPIPAWLADTRDYVHRFTRQPR